MVKRRGHTGEALLIGCGSSEWEEPDLREQRSISNCASLPTGVRCGLVTANSSLLQPQTEPPRQPRRRIEGPLPPFFPIPARVAGLKIFTRDKH